MTARIERVEGTVMAVNSYLVHGPDGIIVVGGQLTIADAHAVRDAVGRTDRPLAGIVITHPHPDHYAGAGLIAPPDVPILATAAVAGVIRRDDELKDTIVGPMMGEQWPARRRFPDQIIEPGSTISLAGLQLTVRDAGPGESHADSIWSTGNQWFIGDLLCPHMDGYLADGHYPAWLASLEWLRSDAPAGAVFYPGHGAPAGREAIAAQRAYIETFVDAVRRSLSLDADQRRGEVVGRTGPLVSDHRLQFLAELSIEPMAAALRTADGTSATGAAATVA
jgi:glyoxylase-like metal-dependent hydrolase (beta-lactamase superfamily II)